MVQSEEQAMAEDVETRGLCSTCNNAAECIHLQRGKPPVLQCEEFDAYQPPRRKVGGQGAVYAGWHLGSDAGEEDSSNYKGLCQDCEDRRACTFPKHEGGVWHCEEYR